MNRTISKCSRLVFLLFASNSAQKAKNKRTEHVSRLFFFSFLLQMFESNWKQIVKSSLDIWSHFKLTLQVNDSFALHIWDFCTKRSPNRRKTSVRAASSEQLKRPKQSLKTFISSTQTWLKCRMWWHVDVC